MQVMCIQGFGEYLSEGIWYTVVQENGDLYKVCDDTGHERYFNKSSFVEQTKVFTPTNKSQPIKQQLTCTSQGRTEYRSTEQYNREEGITATDLMLLSLITQPKQVESAPVEVVQQKSRWEPEPEPEPEIRRSDSWFTPTSYDTGSASSYDYGSSDSYSSGSWD